MNPFDECDHADRVVVPKELGGAVTYPYPDGSGETPPGSVEVCRGCGTVVVELEPPSGTRVGLRFRLPAEAVTLLARLYGVPGNSGAAADDAYRAILLDALDTPDFRKRLKGAVALAVGEYLGGLSGE